MKTSRKITRQPARFDGYRDMNGDYVPFTTSDEVFRRARKLGTRVLLRLQLGQGGELEGLFYTNDEGLGT
ncbi:MAG: hypothetical protein RL434_2063 [Pseudomonadota bacterium]|jgi:hypothetical protein